MKVNVVLHDFCKGWIIEKMAHRLRDALVEIGVEANVTSQGDPNVDVNHFMIFHYVEAHANTRNTMFITHVDDALKVDMIRGHFENGVDVGICMSSHTVSQLISFGLPENRLAFALPACDGGLRPRRIIIGITSNAYADGRKREYLLGQLASEMPLNDFEFQIFGYGWEKTIAQLDSAGALVKNFPGTDDYVSDYTKIRDAIPYFDYYLYLGLDEGALGTLDAMAAGIPTIVTRQGFHVDLPGGITHGFWDYPELKAIFLKIKQDRLTRVETVSQLTWSNYAKRHIEIWQALIAATAIPTKDHRATHTPLETLKFPVFGFREVFFNQYRRNMWKRYWMPRLKKKLSAFPGRVARRLRRLARLQ